MSKLKGSTGRKQRNERYKNDGRSELNRIAKLESHIKKFPNDEKAKAELKRIRKSGTPKHKPTSRGGNTAVNRDKAYRDASGKTLEAPTFEYVAKAKVKA